MQLCQGMQSPSSPAKGRQGLPTGRQELGLLLSPPGSVLSLEAKASSAPHPRLSSTPETSAEMLEPSHLPLPLWDPSAGAQQGVVTRPSTPACTHQQRCPRPTAALQRHWGLLPWDSACWAPRAAAPPDDHPQPPLGASNASLCPLQVPRGGGGREGPRSCSRLPAPAHVQWGHPTRQVLVRAGLEVACSKSCL